MKITKSVAFAALLSTSLITSQAFAAVTLLDPTPAADPAELDATNLATAQAQCDAAAALLDTDGTDPSSDRYTATVVQGTPTYVSGPTEVGGEGDRNIDLETRVGAGTFTPAHLEILGDPYRIGGSVNMFGIQQSVGGHYSNSAYDFTADFNTVYSIPYTCDISFEDYIPPSIVHHNAVGHYNNCDFGHGNGTDNGGSGVCEDVDQPQASCAAINAIGDTWPHWGDDTEQCKFFGDPAYDQQIEESWADPVVTNVPGGSFNQTQTDELSAHESLGAGFDTSETLLIGQVVVCISPSKTGTKLPGAWALKNGYTGTKCTTAWYSGTSPYTLANYAGTSTPNLNDGSHNWVTVPVN